MEAIVATKVGVQERTRRVVVRPRLHRLLDEAETARLVLVSAPAGFGKTTLLADWLGARAPRHAWLSLDQADNDPARFLRYLRRAARELDGERAATAGDDQAAAPPDRDLVLAGIVDRISADARPAWLVLDDYHLIDAPAVHGIVAELLDRMPRAGRLVIATRSDPPLPLARLRARNELVEVRADALRFDVAESGDLLGGSLGLDLEPADVAHLTERTEGWAAALQLAGLSLRGRGDQSRLVREFGASHRFVLDYVVDEVLANLPEPAQRFLLTTSVLGRLSGPLCDAVTGGRDGQDRLEAFERANLLLFPLDDERGWYRYHQLFADLLQARLVRRDPALPAVLHARASAWFEEHGFLDRAVDHALRAGDATRAVALIRGAWLAIMHGGELWTVQGWLDRLPPAVLRADPQLCATYAWGLVLRGESDGVERRLDDARAALERGTAVDPLDRVTVPSQLESIQAKVAELRGDPPGAIRHARAAIDAIPAEIDPVFGALLRGDATSLLGQANLLAGDDHAAAAAFRSSIPLLRRGGNHIGVSHAIHNLARIELGAGRPVAALELCDGELRRLAGPDADVAAYAAVHIGRAEALLALGDRPAATAAAARAAELARINGDGPAIRGAAALQAQIAAGPRPATGSLVEPLTPRELEVLRLMALGRSNRGIAAELFVTLGTVKSHVHAIAGKLGAANRVESVARAREAGLLD